MLRYTIASLVLLNAVNMCYSDDAKPTAELPPTFVSIVEIGKETISIQWTYLVTSYVPVTTILEENGQKVVKIAYRPETKPASMRFEKSTKELKLTTLDGKAADWSLAKGKTIIATTNPAGLSAAYKKLFAPDVLVILHPESVSLMAPAKSDSINSDLIPTITLPLPPKPIKD